MGFKDTKEKVAHAAQKKAFSILLDKVGKKAFDDQKEGYIEVVDAIEKLLGNGWSPVAYEKLRTAFGKDGKWTQYLDELLDRVDLEYLKGLFMSLGYEAGFAGFRKVQRVGKEMGMELPWIIIMDPTSACNLHCLGCWASEYDRQLSLSFEDMDRVVTEGKEFGCHAYLMTGGEPTVRKKDVVRLAEKHPDCAFMLFTNGTLVDQQFCDDMRRCKNIILSISIEGFEEATDARRGKGVFKKVMDAMDLMKANGLVYGTSICYTSQNYKDVTSDEFIDFLISKGVSYSWFFHFMPVGNDAAVELLPTPEQREYMYHRVREIRDWTGGKKIFCMDFQNDGEFVHGCIAGGRHFCHINPNGDMEPCVFIHYSGANIHDMSLMECLKQPIFQAYQKRQAFDDNLLRPCPMLENPEFLRAIVKESGAKSTDMESPESVEHLCSKCDKYAKEWKPMADKLWKESHPDFVRKEN